MPLLILVSDAIGGVLDALGGYHWLFARRFIMPVLMGLVASVVACVYEHSFHSLWIGLMVLPVIGTLTIGYSKDGNAGRGLWVFMQAFMISVGLTLTGHVSWIITIPYVIGAGLLGGLYKNWNQRLGDFICGCYWGLILFFVR